MPYMSNPGGLYDSGVFPDSRPRVDVPSIIDALMGGVQGIARANIQRKLTENSINRQNQELDLRRQQLEREFGQQDWERGMREREMTLNEQREQREALASGVTPAHDQAGTTEVPATIAPMNPSPAAVSPIGLAMGAAPKPGALPNVSVTPSAAPTPGPIQTTVSAPAVSRVDASYDPTKAASYIRATEVAALHNQGLMTRDEARQQFQDKEQQKRLDNARWLAQYRAGHSAANNPIARPMTANAREKFNESLAYAYVTQANGDLQSAIDGFNQLPASQRPQGLTVNHIVAAYGQYQREQANQASRLQGGTYGQDPAEAVGAVRTTRRLLTGGAPKDSTGTPAPAPAPATPTPAPTPAATKPATKPTAQGAPAPARRPLNAREKAAAKSNPAFQQFLQKKGYTAADWK